ncbi:MAG: amidohydrolase [Actinobacteria bacterium]|nr:amidohydrolase [Actinomycetota bacterium]
MDAASDAIATAALGLQPQTVELRRSIHRHPEIGLDLPHTQSVILSALEGLGYRVTTGSGCSSVVATLEEDQGPTVLLRADMDALPLAEETGLSFSSGIEGAMHACGHDTHVAMLLGAARILSERRSELAGRVVLMFQPGEEGFAGAQLMLDEGILEPILPDAAFALHVITYWPAGRILTRPGAMLASADVFRVVVRGRGGHASSPHLALDPIPALLEIGTTLQTMVTRRVSVFDPAVVTVAHVDAGTTTNVIPETAMLEGTVRTLSADVREAVLGQIRVVAEGVAAAHGVAAEVAIEPGYPPTLNDAGMAARAIEVASGLVGADRAEIMDQPVMGAEDFSYVLEQVPGAMVFLSAGDPDASEPVPNHSNRMIVHEPVMADGVALYTALAMSVVGKDR